MRHRQRQGATPARVGPSSYSNCKNIYHCVVWRATCLVALYLIHLRARMVVRRRRPDLAMRYAGFLHGPVLKGLGGAR